MAAAIWLASCGPSGAIGPRAIEPQAVQVRLRGVTARQYRGAALRFELSAGRLILDERDERLEASGSVVGRLEPDLWRRQP